MSDATPSVRPLGPFGDPPPTAVPTQTNGQAAPPDPGGAPHYKTLEEADRAARDFQSRYDQTQARIEKLEARLQRLGGLDQVESLIQQVTPLASRPDFQQYVRGELAPPAAPPDDEFLSEEQREIRTLRHELKALQQGSSNGQSQMNQELAQIRFERAEKEMREMYGEHWEARRPQVLREIQKLGASAGPQALNLIDSALLNKAFLASFEGPREFDEFSEKWRQSRDAARRALVADKGTTPPHLTSPAGTPTAPPTSMAEALRLGMEEARQAGREGRIVS